MIIPAQTQGGDTVITGALRSVTATVVVLVQPLEPVPVTVYIVVVEGETCKVLLVELGDTQEYAVPPVAVKVELFPGQMTLGFAEATIFGG